MALFEDLQWMEEELSEDEEFDEEEYEETLSRRERRMLRREERRQTASMDHREAVFVEKGRKKNPREKGIRRWKFLAFLEFLAILAVIWGWIKWLY